MDRLRGADCDRFPDLWANHDYRAAFARSRAQESCGYRGGLYRILNYVFGSAISGSGIGWIADHFGWGGVFTTMVACCLLTIFFSALTLRHKAQSAGRFAGV